MSDTGADRSEQATADPGSRATARELAWLAVPLLFAAYRPVGFFAQNVDQMTAGDLALTLAIAALAAVVLTALAYAAFRRVEPASILASVILVAFFSYGLVYDAFTSLPARWFRALARRGVSPDMVLLAILVAGAALALYALTRRGFPGPEVVRIAAAFGATLLLVASYQAVRAYAAASKAEALSSGREERASGALPRSSRATAAPGDPDIYFIVLDRYMGADALTEIADFDNAEFLDALRAEGFHVADKAFSNYSITYTSLASTLNMKYVDEYVNLPGYEKKKSDLQVNRDVFYELIGSSRVARELQERGYTYVHVSSGWAATADSQIADRLVNTTANDEYASGFLDSTLARPLASRWTESNQRNRVFAAFDALESVEASERPAFVFAHILSPHPPYVFAADGSDPHLDKEDLKKSTTRTVDAYLQQMRYVNGLALDKIRAIKRARGERPVVIIVQGDHGANWWVRGRQRGADDVRRRKHSILYAVYFGDGADAVDIGEVETPVNTFRTIFDRYFGTKLGKLEDRAFFSSTETWPYWPYEITGLMSKAATPSAGATPTP